MGATEISAHEIPLSSVPTISGSSGAYPLVKAKAEDMNLIAKQAVEDAQTYLEVLNTFLDTLADIDNNIDVEDINTNLPFDPLSFIEDLPIAPTIVMPTPPASLVWNAPNVMFTSSLMESIKTRLSDILVNGVSVLAAIEAAVYERETERDVLVNNDARDKIATEHAKRGAPMPSFGLFNQLAQVDIEYQNKMLDKARSVAEQSLKIEIEMEKFATEIGVKAVAVEGNFHDNYYSRVIEIAKGAVQYGLALFEGELKIALGNIELFASLCKAYGFKAEAIKGAMSIEVARLDAKLKNAANKLQGQIAELDSEIKEAQMLYGIQEQGLQAMAQIQAQLASAALSAFHASASLSSTGSDSISGSINLSENYNHNQAT